MPILNYQTCATAAVRPRLASPLCLSSISLVLAAVSFFSIPPDYPRIYAPLNVFVFIPVLVLGAVLPGGGALLGTAIVPILFWAWCLPGIRPGRVVPIRTLVLLAFAVLGSGTWLFTGHDVGLEYQGAGYVYGVTAISAVCWISLSLLALAAWRSQNVRCSLTFHVALFTWLAWYALPYLGELP